MSRTPRKPADLATRLEDTLDTDRQLAQLDAWGKSRDAQILAAVDYCRRTLRRYKDIEDFAGIVALAVVEAWASYPADARCSFNTWAYRAVRWQLNDQLGTGLVSPPRAARRVGVRAGYVELDAPRGNGECELIDLLAATGTDDL